jgi:hypothetical protein
VASREREKEKWREQRERHAAGCGRRKVRDASEAI